MESVDVVVLGAGAAGLMAAAECARRGRRTVLLEKNERPGLKILISGGGRCNLTTTRSGGDLEAQYGLRRGRFLRHALRSFPPTALTGLVESEGVALQEEDLEKIFPVSRKAADILAVFVGRAQRAGVDLRLETAMREVLPAIDGPELLVRTDFGELRAQSVILATGGLSYPKTGATGDGYPVAEAFGHRLTECVPALAPLRVDEPWLRALQGIVVDARIWVSGPGGKTLVERRRPCLVTHKGLSGPAPMDVSGSVEEHHGACELRMDLCPDHSQEQLDQLLLESARVNGRRATAQALPVQIPERLRVALCREAGADVALAELGREPRRRLCSDLKRLHLACRESLGFGAAEVTRGGVKLSEVDPRTMRSKLDPRLFLCGEILDVDGPIGGFNFQAAFATGRLAGQNA